MSRFLYVLIVVLTTQQASADCVAGTTVGPCLCMEDANGGRALQCSDVADGADITAALQEINVATVTSLDIRNSPNLVSLPDNAFGTTAVLHLRFYNTGLQSLSASTFGEETGAALITLYIKYCSSFTVLDSAMFASLPSLTELYVSATGVSALTDPLPATTLQYIDFNRNSITQISDNFFGSASSLTVVLLAFNDLTSDALANTTQSFAAPGQDLYLDLGYNTISSGLMGLAFPDAAPRELILSGNGITKLTEESFSSLVDAMAAQYPSTEPYILLDNNPLECGCEVAWVTTNPNRAVIKNAMCDNGQLLDNLGPADFADC